MFTHQQLWAGIECLAEQKKLSLSALAIKAKLDPTCFNPSKKYDKSGKERWISTENLSKILNSTNTKLSEFSKILEEQTP